jgi:hypothetical protein
MADLSPAAQAVMDAVLALYADVVPREAAWAVDAEIVAAAIRATANQVVPHEYLTGVDAAVEARQLTRLRLLAIAEELDYV